MSGEVALGPAAAGAEAGQWSVLGAEWLQARVASRAAAIGGGALHERLQHGTGRG